MIPSNFYDPTKQKSKALVMEWRIYDGGDKGWKATAMGEKNESVLWFFPSPQSDKSLTIKWSWFMATIGSNSVKFLRLNPSHWINSKLILPRYFLSFLTSQLSRSLADESYFANGRKSQKYKIYQINVRRKPFPNIIAKSFSSTVIFFLTLENDSRDIS